MNRKQHTLSRQRHALWPDAVVVVQSQMKQRYLSESDAVGTLSLQEWYAMHGTVTGHVINWRTFDEGATVKQWWHFLMPVCDGARNVWIVSLDARDHAAALGLWDLLGTARMTLAGADPYYKEHNDRDNRPARTGMIVLESPPTIICFKEPQVRTVFTWLDPQNWGASRSMLRINRDAFPGSAEAERTEDPAILTNDCGQRVKAVGNWLDGYFVSLVEHDLGAPQHTAASQAHAGWTSSFMQDRIVIHDSDAAIALERDALFGGRCEARFLGDLYSTARPGELHADPSEKIPVREQVGPIHHLDVNSLYPAVARDGLLPIELRAIVRYPDLATILEACKVCAVVAQVKITTERPCVPARHGNYVVWPYGTWNVTLCGPELLLAVRCGAKVVVETACVYSAAPIYRRWVDDLYGAKLLYQQNGMTVMRNVVKSILNASFSKWAQRKKSWVEQPNMIPPAPYTQWFGEPGMNGMPNQYRSLAWRVSRLQDDGEPGDSFPAITATVNSLARVRLFDLIQTAGEENVWYYDTDSLFCNQAGYTRLAEANEIHATQLGKLSTRGVYSQVTILGRQAYLADGKLTLSGCPDPIQHKGETMVRALRSPPIQHYLLKHEAPGLDRHVCQLRVRRPYDHGKVDQAGNVHPHYVSPRPDKNGSRR